MRRQLLFIGILLCALTLSGWGSVASVALCPHAVRAAAADDVMKMDDDHACCPSKDASADEHCSGEATGEMEAMHGMASDEPRGLARIDESCRHCVSHDSSVPTATISMRESQRNGSEDGRPASHEVKALAPPTAKFPSAIIPVQGAPPGQPNRKHLLLSVFLI